MIGKLELDKTFEERDMINHAVVSALDQAAQNWGVKVLRYEIKDLTPPKEILHAMQAQITAERESALIAASEGRKQEQINIAEDNAKPPLPSLKATKSAKLTKPRARPLPFWPKPKPMPLLSVRSPLPLKAKADCKRST